MRRLGSGSLIHPKDVAMDEVLTGLVKLLYNKLANSCF